ncbi:MAG TPA: sigma-54 dependent transcriptional regulator [Thermoanaerobaculia bacterium]
MKKTILVVDDDRVIRESIALYLEAKGFAVLEAADCAAAQIVFRSKRPAAAIIDYALPDGDALELLERFRSVDPDCPVIVLTGHASVDLAVRAIQEGASHFLTKPVELPALQVVLERALETEMLRRQETARKSGPRPRTDPFTGRSAAIRALEAQVRRVIASDAPILIHGETGTGKGVLSRWIHAQSRRGDGPFVDLNCAGLSREFLDTELFGHEKGAFTGAVGTKPGLFEVAHGGTLFLDEIGDIDPQLQPKLLKAVEEKRFRRLGEVQERVVDVRLIGATHRDLAAMSRDGSFRQDLFFRISTFPITVPPLRERVEDIPLLVENIFEELSRAIGRRRPVLDPAALRMLERYPWPGNVRELRNVLERALLLLDGDVVQPQHLVLQFTGIASAASGGDDLHLTLEQLERKHIERVLAAEAGRVDRAAQRLDVPRSSLYQKLKRYGIPR